MTLSISHSDLDGISCQIVIDYYLKINSRMNISYGKIDEYLDILDDYCLNHKPTRVFITDLSFSLEQLKKLQQITLEYPSIHFYFIDHHPSEPECNTLSTKNFVIVLTDKASATKLTNLYIKKNFNISPNIELDKFVSYVNAYDIWLKDTSEFKIGFVYNELFWKYGINHFWSRFKTEWGLRNNNKEDYKEIINKKNKLFNKLIKNGRFLDIGDKDLLLVFLDEYQSFLTIDYPGYKIYTIITSIGRASIRLNGLENNEKEKIKNYMVQELLALPYVETAGGHIGAFGVTFKNNEPNTLITFAKEVMYLSDKALETLKD